MKKVFSLFILLLCNGFVYAQNVGIGTTNPAASAKLEVNSSTQGFLPPRMTEAQRNGIGSPALGLTIFNTSTNCLNIYVGSGWHEVCGSVPYPIGTVHCNSMPTATVNVLNPTTGKTWMDRNLGASRVATSLTDANAYGDLYQWGRKADGHQCRNSAKTTTLSSTDQPEHGDFIISPVSPFDWRISRNDNLWQGVHGVNNPCPSGYRLPSEAELNAERESWSSNNSAGAIGSPLKLPTAGRRMYWDGTFTNVGTGGHYQTSTIKADASTYLFFNNAAATFYSDSRAYGFAVRCIKD